MYFILEGGAEVDLASEEAIIKLVKIKQGKYFGEMGILYN